MSDVPNKASLSTARRHLLEMIQALNFGRIEQLPVTAGEPAFDPPPKVVRELKFGAENGARPELSLEDFLLKAEVREVFGAITGIGDGVIEHIEVRHGLPFRMIVAEGRGLYSPRLHKQASALVQEWADEVLFATYSVHTKATDEGFGRKRVQGIGTGEITNAIKGFARKDAAAPRRAVAAFAYRMEQSGMARSISAMRRIVPRRASMIFA